MHHTDSLQVITAFSFSFPRVTLDFYFSLVSSELHCLSCTSLHQRQMNQATCKDRYHSEAYLLQHSKIVLHIMLSSQCSLDKGTHLSNIRIGCLPWLLSRDRGKECLLSHLSVMCFKIYPISLFYLSLPFHFTGFYLTNSNLQFSVHIFLAPISLIWILLFPVFPLLLFFYLVFCPTAGLPGS